MTTSWGQTLDEKGEAKKRWAALLSVLVTLSLLSVEVWVYLLTGSLAVLGDAAHSLNDLTAAALSYWGVSMAARPPDANHHYGHAKFENLSSLLQMGLLAMLALGIVVEVGLKLALGYEVRMPLLGLGVIALTMVVDFVMSRYLRRVAMTYTSYALEADAAHFATDLWAKIAAMAGLLGAAMGMPWLDPAGALVVASLMLFIVVRLGWRASHGLLDAAPAVAVEVAVRRILQEEAKGARYHSLRMRQAGPWICLDVALDIPGDASLKEAHELACRISQRIRRELPQVQDAVVYVEPEGHHRDCPNGPGTGAG